MKKRLFALFLCLCMVMTLLPVGAFAEGTEAQFGLADGGASVTSVNPVETPDTHITFKFYNGETLLDTQVVNGDGQLTAPATPAIEGGRKFLGWYAVDANGQLEAQEFNFSTAYTNYSGRSEVKVMAKFEAVFYVYFMTVDGQVHSTAIANAANGFKVALPTDYEPNGKVVTGWVVGNDAFTADTVVRADTYVHPVTADCYWVTFNTTGGSMVASRSVTKGDTLNLRGVTAPTRTGYNFKGWSTTADGANVVTSIAPTADTTLYAVWEGDNVTYTVVYWGENPNNTATENIPFDTLLGTESKTAKVGTTVTGSASTASNNTIKNYFTYHSSDSAVVKADNSTVINVYYTRKPFSVTFDLGNSYYNSVSMTVGGKTYTNGRNADKYVLTAKYEQNIESLWPTASNFSSGSNFSGWSVDGLDGTATSKRVTMTADLCSSSGKTAKANYDASCLDHLYYMFESFDQTSPANGNERKQYGNVYYDKSDAYSQDANSGGGKWGQKEITGMTAKGTNKEILKDSGFPFYYLRERNIFLYYTRNEYDFIKNNYGTAASEKVKFGASLADKGGEPARPAGFSENAVFKGWYEVPVGQITDSTLPYDFTGKTMPASKLTLFAYWVEKPVTLTVQVPTLGGYTASNYEVAIGTVISGVDVFKDAEAAIEAAGRTVLKWVYEDGTAVDVNSAIGSDTIVKAVLVGEVYTLTYVTGTDAAITDENRYEYEALAQVKDGSGLKSGDKVFACWTDETGKVYYPGSYVPMTGNKTLTANYVDPSVKVTLTYHSNFDTDQTKTIDAVPNNDKVTVMAYDATGLPSRLGYQVKGWKDANGVEYAVGSEARLDNNGSNDLYAVWEAIDVDYKVEFYYQNTDGTYPDKAKDENIVTRQGKTDSTVFVTAADKADKENGKYVYDGGAVNVESGVVAANGSLVLKLYFKLNQASCTVRYLWNGTDVKVADDKVVPDMTVSQTHTESPITVDGYTYVSSDPKSITIVPDSSKNVITFYYYKNVTLTANSGTVEYNGTERSVSGFTGAPEGADFSAITVGAKGTDAGVYPAEFADRTVGTVDATGKYIVTKANDGSLTITAKAAFITITANSKTREYNGEALTDNGCTFTQGVLVDGDVLQAVVEGSQTDKGSSANVVKSYKVVRGSDDVTGNYKFTNSVDGTLTVTPRVVVIESEGGRRVYNGQPLTNPDYKFTTGSFVDGEVSEVKTSGTITEVGIVDNTIVYTTTDKFDANNYAITLTPGKLEITPVTAEVVVTITENSGSAKYDGTEKTVTGYKVTSISDPLYKESDFTFSGDATIKGTDAGTYDMNLAPGDFTNINKNFTNVTFVIKDATLVISPRTLTITSGSDSKEYDGTPLTRPDVTVSGDGFVEGEVSGIKATGSITYYGEVDNDIKYTKEAGYKDSNYIVTPEIGKLGITRSSKELKVVANSGTWEYDGKFHADGGYTVTFGEESYTIAAGESAKLSTGDTVTAIITKQVKNVADSADGNNAIVTMTIDNAAQYANVSQANGTLTITAKPLTITADSAERVYDGQPLTKNSFTNTELAEGDKLTATVTGSQTNVGSSDNVASAAVIMAGEENVTANYTITYEKGSLTVTPVTDEVIVTVTERGGDYLYDGGEKVVTGYDAVSSNPLYTANDYSFSGDATVKSTNAGSYDMELAPEDFKNTSTNFTNVTFIIVDGKLNIAQRKVLMTSADDEKVYDGTPLTNSTVTVTGDGFAEGEGAAYTVTGSQLDEGSSNNSFTYELNEGTLAANYIIETKEGELTVKPILTEITITANSGEKMYDGSALINGGYTFTSGILVDGDVLTAVVEGSQLNAGSSANVVKSYRVMRGETDVTANYRFAESVDGKLTVTARKVVMTSADDEKVYDGTPLTNDEITVTGDGFIEGEGVTYDVTGSQLDVGSSDNSFTYELNEGTLAENYIIETEEGKLTVTSPEQHIVITANSAEKTYDGTPLTDDGFTYTDFVLAEGDVLEAVIEGSQTDAGSSVNVIKSYRVMRGDEDVTANYIFDDSVDGTLTVTKRKVTLTSGTACKIYDGKYLTCNKVEVGGDGFVEGEGATYDVTGKRKDIGWSYNDFTYKLNDNTKADNYEITVERGFLYVKDQAEKPKTGDSSDLLLLLALMSMSGAGAAGTVYLYRRKREEQE